MQSRVLFFRKGRFNTNTDTASFFLPFPLSYFTIKIKTPLFYVFIKKTFYLSIKMYSCMLPQHTISRGLHHDQRILELMA